MDVRTVHRHIRKGTLAQTEYDAHLAALPDGAEGVAHVDLDVLFASVDESARPAPVPRTVIVAASARTAPTSTVSDDDDVDDDESDEDDDGDDDEV